MTIGGRPNKKNIESLDLTRKVNFLRLWRGKNIKVNEYFTSCLGSKEPPKRTFSASLSLSNWTAHLASRYLFEEVRAPFV